MAFLYGFSATKLQDFIFRTNVLQEIIGASEIIKSIDSLGKDLQGFFSENGISLNKNPEIILTSAGNLRSIFDDEADLQKVVLHLPKLIAKHSYGLGVAQAVVKYEGDYANATSLLESKLKIARNKLDFPLDFSHCILKHNPKTALPQSPNTQSDDKYRKIDKSTFQKLQAFDNKSNPDSINELAKLKNAKNKIALIYADGNALGNIVRTLSKDEMKSFSTALDNATKEAFAKSHTQIKDKYGDIKIREVICGGDDLVVVCNADIALDFAKAFLEHFENLTRNIHKGKNLTACAGIAFFNHKYPIHYALKLAKDLCKEAKSHSKALDLTNPPSSLMFHNIQSSAVQSFSTFIDDELSLGANQGKEHIVRLDFGAYFLRDISESSTPNPTIENLQNVVEIFREADAPTSRLRQWLSMLDSNKNLADNELKQIAKIYAEFAKNHNSALQNLHKDLSLSNLIIQKDGFSKTPIYDILSIISNTAQASKIKKGDL